MQNKTYLDLICKTKRTWIWCAEQKRTWIVTGDIPYIETKDKNPTQQEHRT